MLNTAVRQALDGGHFPTVIVEPAITSAAVRRATAPFRQQCCIRQQASAVVVSICDPAAATTAAASALAARLTR